MERTVTYERALEIVAKSNVDMFVGSYLLANMFDIHKWIVADEILKYRNKKLKEMMFKVKIEPATDKSGCTTTLLDVDGNILDGPDFHVVSPGIPFETFLIEIEKTYEEIMNKKD